MKIYRFEKDKSVLEAKKYVWIIAGCSELIYGEEAKSISDDTSTEAQDLSEYAASKFNSICEGSIDSIELSEEEESHIYDIMSSDLVSRALLETGIVLNSDINQLTSCLEEILTDDTKNFLDNAYKNGNAIIVS